MGAGSSWASLGAGAVRGRTRCLTEWKMKSEANAGLSCARRETYALKASTMVAGGPWFLASRAKMAAAAALGTPFEACVVAADDVIGGNMKGRLGGLGGSWDSRGSRLVRLSQGEAGSGIGANPGDDLTGLPCWICRNVDRDFNYV